MKLLLPSLALVSFGLATSAQDLPVCEAACLAAAVACSTAGGFAIPFVPFGFMGFPVALVKCSATYGTCKSTCNTSLGMFMGQPDEEEDEEHDGDEGEGSRDRHGKEHSSQKRRRGTLSKSRKKH